MVNRVTGRVKARPDAGLEHEIHAAACTRINVLITGGTAALRWDIAERIHEHSRERHDPFVVASGTDPRRFDTAIQAPHCATIFIDEIGALDPYRQEQLMNLIDRRRRSDSPGAGCRVIAGAASSVYGLVVTGEFSAPLFYRLNMLHLLC